MTQLEQELATARASKDSAFRRVRELKISTAKFEASKPVIRAEAVEAFQSSEEYINEVGSKAASKFHGTYPAAEKYLKKCPDGGFVVDFFLAEEKAQIEAEAAGSPVPE